LGARRSLLAACGALTLLMTAGCFEVRSNIYLNPDGSGHALVSYAIMDSILQGGPFDEFLMLNPNGKVGLDKNKIAQRIAERPGLELRKADVWTDGENHYARLDINFAHISNLGEKDISYDWLVEDGGWVFRIVVNKKPSKSAVDSPLQKGLSKSFSDKGFFFTVHLPGKIIESNASEVNWNVAEFLVPASFYLSKEEATKVFYAKIEASTWDKVKAWFGELLP
jgi:hypothetical protein